MKLRNSLAGKHLRLAVVWSRAANGVINNVKFSRLSNQTRIFSLFFTHTVFSLVLLDAATCCRADGGHGVDDSDLE